MDQLRRENANQEVRNQMPNERDISRQVEPVVRNQQVRRGRGRERGIRSIPNVDDEGADDDLIEAYGDIEVFH